MRVCLIAFLCLLLLSSALAQPDGRPNLSKVWQAAWRLETVVGAWQAGEMRRADLDTLDPAFDAWQASEGTDYREYPAELGRLPNRPAYDAWTSQLDTELRDRRTLGSDG